ncbi:MAG: single-stranded DNA-binding protein [Candidatus Acetothermia bacterium]|jgi:single-strand DNA-binding protein|nr:single-stranded DNA-binding protein [Candidatus Acetothermia bacterium]MDH7505686.1 single-stranded DNA-binding protein [Candidatus Acetothermia bacterium]
MGLNRVILTVNLTADPELRYTQSGRARTRFTIAVNQQYRDQEGHLQETTIFVPIVVWGPQAEFCANFLKKGQEVAVDGRLRIDTFETREGKPWKIVEVIAQHVELPGGRPAEAKEELPEEPEPGDEEALSEVARDQAPPKYHPTKPMYCWNCKTTVQAEGIWDDFDERWNYRCTRCGYLIGSHR